MSSKDRIGLAYGLTKRLSYSVVVAVLLLSTMVPLAGPHLVHAMPMSPTVRAAAINRSTQGHWLAQRDPKRPQLEPVPTLRANDLTTAITDSLAAPLFGVVL